MRIAIFTHPPFMNSQSMPRFARMLEEAYTARGHTVSLHSAVPVMRRWITHPKLAKWAGYVDQYLLFPRAAANAVVLLGMVMLIIVGLNRLVDLRKEL